MEAVEISGFHFLRGVVVPVLKLAQELMLVIYQRCICLDEMPNSGNCQSLYALRDVDIAKPTLQSEFRQG